MWLTKRRKNSAKAVIDHAIHEAIRVADGDSHFSVGFARLLRHVQTTTALLRFPTVGGRIETCAAHPTSRQRAACLGFSSHGLAALGSKAGNHRGRAQCLKFGSLAMHLLARIPGTHVHDVGLVESS